MPEEFYQNGEELSHWTGLTLVDLPDDVLYVVFSFCDVASLGRLCCVCRRLSNIVNRDFVWARIQRKLPVIQVNPSSWTNQHRRCKISVKQSCRLGYNWRDGRFVDRLLIRHNPKQLPWLQLYDDHLWASANNRVDCHKVGNRGSLKAPCHSVQLPGPDDVTRFVCKDGHLAAGSRSGDLLVSSIHSTPRTVWSASGCHDNDIHCVDLAASSQLLISGSRDKTVKLWRVDDIIKEAVLTVPIEDRVWSVTYDPSAHWFIVGSAGLNTSTPLQQWSTERGERVGVLGRGYRRGAGVLDLQFDTPHTFFSCGYDTYIRLWDLRTSNTQCVAQWMEPFDQTIYCVQADNAHSFVAGTSMHGMLRLWDKRCTTPVQLYYVGKQVRSPVFSVALQHHRLYAALDRGIHALNF